jgi:carbonic anhydrase
MKLYGVPGRRTVHPLEREVESSTSRSLEGTYTMATFDTLMKRNKDFASHQFVTISSLNPTLEGTPRSATALISACADPRDAPAYMLGFEPGEAVVLRNIGGRITPGTLQLMALLNRIGQVAGEHAGEHAGSGDEYHHIVLQHTVGLPRIRGVEKGSGNNG